MNTTYLKGWAMARFVTPMTEIEQAEWDIRMRDPRYRLAMLTLLRMGLQWRREVALKEHRARMKRLKAEGTYETWLAAKMERNKRYPKKPRPPAPLKPKKVTVAERLKADPEFAYAYYARKRAVQKERLQRDPVALMEHQRKRSAINKEYHAKRMAKDADGVRQAQREGYARRMASDPENRERHRAKVLKSARKRAANGKSNAYMRNKRATDINFRIASNLRRRVNNVLRGNSKSAHTLELLGCTIPELRKHLESKFLPGMTWANYGNGVGFWNIDHIKPCTAFDLSSEAQQWECFNWKNLQPLWYVDNISKGDRMVSPCPPPSPA